MANPKKNQDIARSLVGLTIGEAIVIGAALLEAQRRGKIERPSRIEVEKPKYRKVLRPDLDHLGLRRKRICAPGEAVSVFEGHQFKQLCKRACVPCTKRQASKFVQRRGLAYAHQQRETLNKGLIDKRDSM